MDVTGPSSAGSETQDTAGGAITVRYWAAARAAAGVEADTLDVAGPLALGEVVARAVARHPESGLERVVGVCSVLVGERPVSSSDPGAVLVEPGETVELLPPFAGG